METSSITARGPSSELNFLVDELLDFPSEFDEQLLCAPTLAKMKDFNSPPLHADIMSSAKDVLQHAKLELSEEEAFEEPVSGLCVPPDEIVFQLEWLSSFNDDNCFLGTGTTPVSMSEPSSSRAGSADLHRCMKETSMMSSKPRESFNSHSPVSVLEQGADCYRKPDGAIHACKSHRVRKARTGGRIWSLDILKPVCVNRRTDYSHERTGLLLPLSSSSVHSQALCSFLPQEVLERPPKKMKKAPSDVDSVTTRRCMHCLAQKTPQWRAGPQGPKTLCNACGVRYKSGRLVPEYRPVASPTFVNAVHSNSHRRILEMRRAKEVESCGRLHKSKVESREEADKRECRRGGRGGSASKGRCDESMFGLQVHGETGVWNGGLLCEQLGATGGDDGSGTIDLANIEKHTIECNSNGDNTAPNLIETDSFACMEELVPVSVSQCNMGVTHQGESGKL